MQTSFKQVSKPNCHDCMFTKELHSGHGLHESLKSNNETAYLKKQVKS